MEEQPDLVTDLLDKLEERGVPHGTWLLEIEEWRQALHEIDTGLLRLHDAIIRDAHDQERPGGSSTPAEFRAIRRADG